MADQHLECDGAAIAYEINGEGPLVGYAHGLFISRRMERWLRLVDWTPVRRGRRFLEYDARPRPDRRPSGQRRLRVVQSGQGPAGVCGHLQPW